MTEKANCRYLASPGRGFRSIKQADSLAPQGTVRFGAIRNNHNGAPGLNTKVLAIP